MLKINRNYKAPTWEDVFGKDKGHSHCEYVNATGAKHYFITGYIGWSGKKIHKLSIYAVDTPEGLGIVDAESLCGSQRWGSGLKLTTCDDMQTVNCQRCNK